MRQLQEVSFTLGDATADITGLTINAGQLFAISLQAVAVGTLAGTLKFQFSNDVVLPGIAPTHWSDITGASVAVSNSGTYIIVKTDLCYNYVRAFYAHTSHTATPTITASINAQGV